MTHKRCLLIGLLMMIAGARGYAMEDLNLPADAPQDAVMADATEVAAAQAWVGVVFAGEPLPGAVRLDVRRQDHSHLHFDQSAIGTPLRIGRRSFAHGLGTHANSEIVVEVPSNARAFRAVVGVDNNADTGGARGTVQFYVEADGRPLLTTPLLHGGQEPVAVNLPLPGGCRELTLKVSDGGDGAAFDQADWADARFMLADGSEQRLETGQSDLLYTAAGPPFSFVYNGRPSAELLRTWPRTVETRDLSDRKEYTVRWTDPQTGLRVTAEVKAYHRYPAADWALYFENRGDGDTPIIENIRALDTGLRTGYARNPLILHQLQGDACGESSFVPFDTSLEAGKSYRLAPTGGRPSSISAFPWFNAQYADRGAIVAIGWTGQWSAEFSRAPNGPGRLTAGMELTHLRLHAGERIRTPRIVTLFWQNDRQQAHLQFRRLALFHYAPRLNDRPLRLPVALQTFDRYWKRPGWATEEGQIAYAKVAHDLGCDTLWLDAAWFPGGFPNGVGSWFCEPKQFPRGLKPVTDEAHRLGMQFVLWFEPERVAEGSEVAREHPEFVMGGSKGGLFKLNDPTARRWMTDRLSQCISEYGLDVYRNDFNIDPLPFWRQNDAPDRQGMTEIGYIEGLYAMWDELRALHPGLWIDNCAGGGRRMDIEMCSRSVPLWRSDTGCSPGHVDWNHAQSLGLGQYVPLFTVATWSPEPYEARSGLTGGAICEWGYLEPGFPTAQAKAAIREIKACQYYWYGDFYPLTPASSAPDQFAAWQLHRTDLNAGMVQVFRHRACSPLGLVVSLQGIETDRSYRVEFSDANRRKSATTMTGKELQEGLTLKLPEPGSSLLVTYRAVGK